MVKILDRDNPILRERALEVTKNQFGTKKLEKVISDMKKALATQPDGVAIAAPQIGQSLRIFVVAGNILSMLSNTKNNFDDLVFINPVITKESKEKKYMEEGCLSVRYLYGKVKRSTKITITAQDEKGVKFTKGVSGLLAQIFQHETDHLEGVLFTDKAKDVEDLPREVWEGQFKNSLDEE